jgi:hypothetical protein
MLKKCPLLKYGLVLLGGMPQTGIQAKGVI